MRYYISLLVVLFSISACLTPPDYSIEPEIEFISISKSPLLQGFGRDTTILTFSFTDGDGDLGSDSTVNIFVYDNRTGNSYSDFRLPVIPPQGNDNGISGEIAIEMYSDCCILLDNPQPCQPSVTYPLDTLSYDIYIEDEAGHRSNTITTSELILICN